MTREINTFGKTLEHKGVNTHITAAKPTKKCLSSFIKGALTAYTKAVKAKRDISDSFVALTEALADKTAREGLFGEDRGKNYCGTDTDYIA